MKGAQAQEYKEKSESRIDKYYNIMNIVSSNLKSESELFGLNPTLDELEKADKILTKSTEIQSNERLIDFWKLYNKV